MSGVRNPLWFVLGFAALSHVLWVVMGDTVFSHGKFADGDSYVRLVHLRELYETGNWFGDEFPRANAPFGTTIHWTRLFDILTSVILLPVRAFVDFETALWIAAVLVCPLIYLGTVAAMAWAVRPVIGRTAAYIAGALTVTQYAVMSFSMVGRADHHIVFAFLLIMTVGFMVRLLGSGTYRARDAVGLGISIALGVWTGTEVFLLIGACMAILGLTWMWGEPNAAEKNFMFALSLTISLAVALMIERGPGMFTEVEYDKISVVHLVFAAHVLAFWSALRWLGARAGNIPAHLVWAVAGLIVLVSVYWLIFPKFFSGPTVDMDPRLKILLEYVVEYRVVDSVPRFLVLLGTLLLVLPWTVYRLREKLSSDERWVWIFLALLLIIYTSMTAVWVRWSLYVGILFPIFLADLMVHLDGKITHRFSGLKQTAVIVPVMALVAVGPSSLGVLGIYLDKKPEDAKEAKSKECSIQKLLPVLNGKEFADRSRVVVAPINFGGEILYRTRHSVVGIVQHRTVDGIFDGLEILRGAEDKTLLPKVHRRKLDMILICPGSGGDSYIVDKQDEDILYKRLVRGALPNWIREISLSKVTDNDFRLFEVVKDN
ncbi:MAG: hypothetical protein HOB79_16855 [Rhodospirillaceae bacterium]|nr:hypothetical protein [Rhodospirillaceae bacterium]